MIDVARKWMSKHKEEKRSISNSLTRLVGCPPLLVNVREEKNGEKENAEDMRLTFLTCQSKPSQWGCTAYGGQLQLFFVFVCFFFPLPSIRSFISLHIWPHFLLAWLVCLFSISPCAQAALDFQKPLCSGFCSFNYGNYFGKMQLFLTPCGSIWCFISVCCMWRDWIGD